FDHQNPFLGRDFESAPEGKFALVLFREDKAKLQLPGDFLAQNQAAEGWRDDRRGAHGAELIGEGRAQLLDHRHLLQGGRALERLPAMQPASQNKMAFEERAGPAEDVQNFGTGHRLNQTGKGDFLPANFRSDLFAFRLALAVNMALLRNSF